MAAGKGFFAIRFKALRNKANFSQSELADASGVSVASIRHFEYGLREPTFDTLVKLARGLGVGLSAFDEDVGLADVEMEARSPAPTPTEEKPTRKRRPKKDG